MRLAGCGLLFALGGAMLASPARPASFDCTKAATADERAVCAAPRLSDLDTLMNRAYAEARAKAEPGDRPKALADARVFMERRGRCGSDLGCLTAAYVGVIEDLQNYGSTVGVPPSISALDMAPAIPPETRALPAREGDCTATHIAAIGGRLEGDTQFESGTTVEFANGGAQVSYEREAPIVASRKGDRVLICLTSLPKHCPPGDDRGRMYTTTNLRTHGTWSLPDSQHRCGGA